MHDARVIEYPQAKKKKTKINFYSSHIPYTEINSEQILVVNVKLETIKFSGKKERSSGYRTRQKHVRLHTEDTVHKRKINTLDLT